MNLLMILLATCVFLMEFPVDGWAQDCTSRAFSGTKKCSVAEWAAESTKQEEARKRASDLFNQTPSTGKQTGAIVCSDPENANDKRCEGMFHTSKSDSRGAKIYLLACTKYWTESCSTVGVDLSKEGYGRGRVDKNAAQSQKQETKRLESLSDQEIDREYNALPGQQKPKPQRRTPVDAFPSEFDCPADYRQNKEAYLSAAGVVCGELILGDRSRVEYNSAYVYQPGEKPKRIK